MKSCWKNNLEDGLGVSLHLNPELLLRLELVLGLLGLSLAAGSEGMKGGTMKDITKNKN